MQQLPNQIPSRWDGCNGQQIPEFLARTQLEKAAVKNKIERTSYRFKLGDCLNEKFCF